MSNKVHVVQTNAKEETFWDKLKSHLPTLGRSVAIFILVLNIIIPGLGTAFLCCIGGTCKTEHLIIGLIQFCTAFCLVGWLWSIMWGLIILMKSNN